MMANARAESVLLSTVLTGLALMLNLGLCGLPAHHAAPQRSPAMGSKVDCTDLPNAKEPAGPGCAEELFARRGLPYMFVNREGIRFGVSFAPAQTVNLVLWVDNRSDKPESFLVCCSSTVFAHLEIVDQQGKRVWSRNDQIVRKARLAGEPTVDACSCSGWVDVPPHTLRILGGAELADGYALPPGHYFIVERFPAVGENLDEDAGGAPRIPSAGLLITYP
jgi:hypothetical protein